jgi:hypothetical protein
MFAEFLKERKKGSHNTKKNHQDNPPKQQVFNLFPSREPTFRYLFPVALSLAPAPERPGLTRRFQILSAQRRHLTISRKINYIALVYIKLIFSETMRKKGGEHNSSRLLQARTKKMMPRKHA